MALNFREGFWGLEHLRIALCRHLFRMPADSFIKRFEGKGASIGLCLDLNESPRICERCGFYLVKVTYPNEWFIEMCSALPHVNLESPAYQSWLTTLVSTKSIQTESPLEPILHD